MDILTIIFSIGTPVVAMIIALNAFMRDTKSGHKKLIEGIDRILADCKKINEECRKSNEECRKELKESQLEFISTLKDILKNQKNER